MKVLVTGGNGFLGQHLVSLLLKEGLDVRVLGRQEHFASPCDVDYLQGDIRNFSDTLKATKGVEGIFHVAAKAGIESNPKLYHQINVEGTRHMLEACRKNGVPNFIYTSSPSVVFNGTSLRGIDESAPYAAKPLCDYARTKIQAEKLVLNANSAALKTIALRPHLLFGRGDQNLIPRILQRSRSGHLMRIGSGKNLTDITHIDNAAYAHYLAFQALYQKHPGGKAYFIGQERPVNLWETIDTILQRLKEPKVQRSISFPCAYTMGFILEKFHQFKKNHKEPLMTRFLATALHHDQYFSQEAAKKDLGYIPKISIEEGLQDYDTPLLEDQMP